MLESSAGERPGAESDDLPASRTALLVIDMLNDYQHDDGPALAATARSVVGNIAALIARARESEVLVVHVNDNHGMWAADRPALIRRAYECGDPALIEPIVPADDAPFVFKARHSVFYGTSLEYLLERKGIRRIVLTGQVTEQCILYSALDAYIRHYDVVIPEDCVAHIDPRLAQAALDLMTRNMRAQVVQGAEVFAAPARA